MLILSKVLNTVSSYIFPFCLSRRMSLVARRSSLCIHLSRSLSALSSPLSFSLVSHNFSLRLLSCSTDLSLILHLYGSPRHSREVASPSREVVPCFLMRHTHIICCLVAFLLFPAAPASTDPHFEWFLIRIRLQSTDHARSLALVNSPSDSLGRPLRAPRGGGARR